MSRSVYVQVRRWAEADVATLSDGLLACLGLGFGGLEGLALKFGGRV